MCKHLTARVMPTGEFGMAWCPACGLWVPLWEVFDNMLAATREALLDARRRTMAK